MSDNFDAPWDEPDKQGLWTGTAEDPEIIGKVRSIGYEAGKFGRQLAIVVNRNDGSGEWKIFCSAVLERAAKEKRPAPGDDIRIKFFGTEVSEKTGNSYKVMQMRLRRANPDVTPPPISEEVSSGLPDPTQFDDDIPY